MAQMLRRASGWWKAIVLPRSVRTSLPYGLKLATDPTLLNPSRPYETSSVQAVREIRNASGLEPASRTVVNASPAGHTAQIFLLKSRHHVIA